ncbi:acyl carrier protein [Dactylosporangium aurantiacum]|uniref:Acyl carrier protein n=1 Tax=Dactylosporangium aurantiacum TaxID=35754 RepID=A0A9Q9IFT0_9ACTN|nr:acyl carrier protein [Dactylosporangium aurantiacum]MDG6101802.1 acyl carrier protein [Dactylosporangium aurantiacum]UWZ52393.1 acyl carrier protein [Dactylosporangium aurantiacum]
MAQFSIDQLIELLRDSAGEDEAVDLTGDVLDVPFDQLGYDSLALLNTVSRIERDNGIHLSDSVVTDAKTPRLLLDEVNARLGRRA